MARRAHSTDGPLTTHHLIKWIALIIMTLDHFGAFLAPEMLWLRVIGRITFPVWFFLIGHGLSYRSSRELALWAIGLAVISPFLGVPLFPLNALVTILFCQYLLRLNERSRFIERQTIATIVACMLFVPLSSALMEYGTQAVLYAFMGYAVREGLTRRTSGQLIGAASYLVFVPVQLFMYPFSPLQSLWVAIATGLVTLILADFKHQPIKLPAMRWLEKPALWLARHSMQYYVLHRIVLQAIGLVLGILPAGLRLIRL